MSMVGQILGRYRITGKLGEGGMGIVYYAEDTALERRVAVKVLKGEGSRDPDRLRRFSLEARAASALNHPNIVTVHDIGEFEGQPFLVMELVEGESLRNRVSRGALPLQDLLGIGVQASTALARAHEEGITHRDLKPENILLRPDGYVKVMDFGLAKLKEKEPQPFDSAAQTEQARTSAGALLGTAAYMSPEQAAGREADGRSDVFSLALVLFECWQGRNPFQRSTALDTLHSIVHDPLPSTSFPPASADWALGRVLDKALAKDPDERYQTMKDLAIDLRRLKQESQSGAVVHAPSGVIQGPAIARASRARMVLYAFAVLGIALIAGAVLLFRGGRQAAPARTEYVQITNFTDSATSPALSRDGRMLAFKRSENTFSGPGEIYVKLLPDGEPVQLTHDQHGKMSPVFSLDGSRIAYTVLQSSFRSWDTWVVPVLGGEPRSMLPNASGLTWVDDRHLLFSEVKGTGIHMALVMATESRAEARDVYVPPTEDGMAHRSYVSPDGHWVLAVEMAVGSWLPCRLVPFQGGSQGKIVGPQASQCTAAAWSPDGSWMYFSANIGSGFHTWRQRFPDGAPEQITFGATEEEGIALAPDGRSFISSVGSRQSAIWIHDSEGDRQLSSEGFAYEPRFSRDGLKLYYLLRSGSSPAFVLGELWLMDLASGRRERLLPDFLISQYDISADGRHAVFSAPDVSGKDRIWLASLEGRFPPRRLTSGESVRVFFGPDGDLLFQAAEGQSQYLYRMKEDGTGARKAFSDPVQLFFGLSPDGRWALAWVPGSGEISNAVMAFPLDGGTPRLICNGCGSAGGPERGSMSPVAGWSAGGRWFYIQRRQLEGMGAGKTFAVPLASGQVFPPLPASGIRSEADLASWKGRQMIPRRNVFLGPDPATYVYVRSSTQRNLYRIPVP